ncbi:MAG: tetratricopeptide repeat protein [Chryseolinea sp.]
MPSLLPNFEYDVFISYRHNDNRSGWVTEFVKHLNEELAATIKEPVSVYFDSNLYDGLLENHSVDKSLETKLRSAILIPVLSQIYCDTKSFAWQHEFCAFNTASQKDPGGRDVQLKNGNITSRILPITIHNIDHEDTELIEAELNAKLRSIDFTFRSPGVNRPLRMDDKRSENVNQLSYHDQLNKLANAIKEIISAIRNPKRSVEGSLSAKAVSNEPPRDEKSLAVLPFANLSQDPTQEYFSDGITENIIMQLGMVPQFRVISRTSVMRYKKTTKTIAEIAEELDVKFLVEGSAQAHKDKVRIRVQLIDASLDKAVWSKVFMENMDDIFEIQNTVSEVVAKELSASFNPQQSEKLIEAPTKNLEAYDLFLKGRHAFNQWAVDGYRSATEYFKKAIALDPEFKEAYSYLASSYSARMSWNGDLSPEDAQKNITIYLTQAWQRGPSDNDYLTKSFVEFFISKDFAAAEQSLLSAIKMNPNNGGVFYGYAYLLNMTGRFDEAASVVEQARKIDPLTVGYFNHHAIGLYLTGRYETAIETIREALQLYPSVIRFYDFLARIYLTMERYEDVVKSIETGLRTASIRPPSMIAFLAAAYAGLNDSEKCQVLVDELTQRSSAGEKGVNIYLVPVFNAMHNVVEANRWLAKARATNDVDLIWLGVDPLLKNLKPTEVDGPDFMGARQHIVSLLDAEMPKFPYHNINHIEDVLHAAAIIAEAENIAEGDKKLIELAALLHDVGFIRGSKNHEESGATMTREILPAFGYDPMQIDIICSMIIATRLPQSPTSILEKILCDADLDYLGRSDFYEIGDRLFEEMFAKGVVESEREWNLVQKTFLESHRYHTAFSKAKRESYKQERLQEVIVKLKTKKPV